MKKETLIVQDMKFYRAVADLICEARKNVEKSINTTMVYTYYEIGKKIVVNEQRGKERAEYGKHILRELSDYLTEKLGKGFSVDNLKLMRRFYLMYTNQKNGESAIPQFNERISWTQYIHLMRITNEDERKFYEIETANNSWSVRELQRQYNSSLYERLALSRNKEEVLELSRSGQIIANPRDLLKDPYILEFTGLSEKASYTESDLELKLIDHLQQFLLELGKGFAYIGRQVRFSFSEEHFYVDLVFYNRLIRSFVLLDLKIGKIKHQDIGQMQMYVNYYDRNVKLPDENPTIGIVLCKDKKDSMVELMLPEDNNQIFARRYQTVLPSKEELQRALEIDDAEYM